MNIMHPIKTRDGNKYRAPSNCYFLEIAPESVNFNGAVTNPPLHRRASYIVTIHTAAFASFTFNVRRRPNGDERV